jgi:hypothetical protein
MKSNFSRRDFLKTTLFGLGAAFLAACEQVLGITETPPPTSIQVVTEPPTIEPAATEPPTVEPTEPPVPTESPTPTELPCFKLLTPANGAKLGAVGKVTFSWEEMTGAASYELQVTLPTGQVISFETDKTSRDQYLEALKMAGQFQWQVVAFDSTSAVICIAEPFTFEKEKAPAKNNDGGGGDTAGGGDNATTSTDWSDWSDS